METTLPQNVIDARNALQNANTILGQFNSKGYSIEDDLRRTVQEALDYNKDIIELRSKALADYLAAPSQAQVKFGVPSFTSGEQTGQTNPDYIWNPFERNAVIQQYISNQMIPFSMYNSLLGQREGQIGNLIGAGMRAYQAAQAAAAAQAQAAQQYYANILNEFTTMQDIIARNKQLEQAQQQINLAKERAVSARGRSNISDLISLMGMMGFLPEQNVVSGRSQEDFTHKENLANKFVVEFDWRKPFEGLQTMYRQEKQLPKEIPQSAIDFANDLSNTTKSRFIDYNRK